MLYMLLVLNAKAAIRHATVYMLGYDVTMPS